MLPKKHCRGLVQLSLIQPPMVMQRGVAGKGAVVRRIQHAVAVMLAHHVKAGMEARLGLVRIHHADILWKPRIQGERELFRRYTAVRVKMRNLRRGVNAAVRPSRCMERAFVSGQLGKLLLHHLLYTKPGKLPLPARVCRAVVLNYHAHAPRHIGYTSPLCVCIKQSSISPSIKYIVITPFSH